MIKSLEKVFQDPNLNIQALKTLAENSFDSILITDATNRAVDLRVKRSTIKRMARHFSCIGELYR